MKAIINTQTKTIQLQENIKLVDLVEELDKLGINEEEYTLVVDQVNIYSPWYIPYGPTTGQPLEQQPITWQTSDGTFPGPENLTITTNYHYDSGNK